MTRNHPPTMTIGDHFRQDPTSWGLRGDPVLWQQLRDMLMARPLPADVAILHLHLDRCFADLTGQRIDTANGPVVGDKFRRPDGGMSNGQISPEFWRETAIPLIERRFIMESTSHANN